jgi:inorganic pyrophosphatase
MRGGGAVFALLLACGCASSAPGSGASPGWTARDSHTWTATGPAVSEIAARNADGSVNALIEIPAGTNAKWELRKSDGALAWELRDGRPRVVDYLAYPANYGMIPRTLLAEEDGGDGDPLDVIVLGPALDRGAVAPVRVVGVLRLSDGGERDGKLVAVAEGSPFEAVRDIADLDADFPGVTAILETWFTHYKGSGVLVSGGYADARTADAILLRAERGFADAN